jgi:hypothetical protein
VTDPRVAYAEELVRASDDLDDALQAIRAETAAGRITTVKAAAERTALLTKHLERCGRLRAAHPDGRGGTR